MFFLLMYIHLVGCLWYYIINSTKIWIPLLDYIDGWEAQGAFFEKGTKYKYMVSTYVVCLTLFGNDVGARDDNQILFISILNLIGAIVQG